MFNSMKVMKMKKKRTSDYHTALFVYKDSNCDYSSHYVEYCISRMCCAYCIKDAKCTSTRKYDNCM